jgi:hypothetical protein
MVGDALLLIFGDLVGYDGQPLIELHRISIDDFSIVFARYLNRQLTTVISIDSASGQRTYI